MRICDLQWKACHWKERMEKEKLYHQWTGMSCSGLESLGDISDCHFSLFGLCHTFIEITVTAVTALHHNLCDTIAAFDIHPPVSPVWKRTLSSLSLSLSLSTLLSPLLSVSSSPNWVTGCDLNWESSIDGQVFYPFFFSTTSSWMALTVFDVCRSCLAPCFRWSLNHSWNLQQ